MSGSLMGGGIVLTVAAALWLLYLVPTWLRRREYLATERNAVRLQQTLRILAETAEAPKQIAAEATARGVAAQERALKTVRQRVDEQNESRALAEAQRAAEEQLAAERARFEEIERQLVIARLEAAAAEAAAQAEAEELAIQAEEAVARVRARAFAAQAEQIARAAQVVQPVLDDPMNIEEVGIPMVNTVELERRAKARKRSLRRARAATSLLLLAGLVAIIVGAIVVVVAGSWVALIAGVVAVLASLGILTGLARAGRTAPLAAAASATIATAVPEFFDHAESEAIDEQYAQEVTWTPQPLPKPLHLSEGTRAASAMASIDAAKELQRAAARADLEARAAELVEDDVATLKPRVTEETVEAAELASTAAEATVVAPAVSSAESAQRIGSTSRFASMGLLDDVNDAKLDVDAVLRRRRAS